MRLATLLCLILMTVQTAFAQLPAAEPLLGDYSMPEGNKGVLIFNSSKRFDLNLLAEFDSECSSHPHVPCVYIDTAPMDESREIFEDAVLSGKLFHAEDVQGELPRALFIKDGDVIGEITSSITLMTGIHLGYLSGGLSPREFKDAREKALQSEQFRRIVPKMNFVLMLAKKGERMKALEELDKIEVGKLNDKGLLLLGQTYLRLKAPDRAEKVLDSCSSNVECRFFTAISVYLQGDAERGAGMLESMKEEYPDKERLEYYLNKMQGEGK
ncbi:hypothetical protein [Limisalsivibrio acetivorans]|uniref:hypothetical protein n=1 Tax=Limisalsivibrio acetivorans TaxID=1304888 RepID=UPI0003B73AC1|nr:hypothetical protein [Limisalsivibrio acetivorans]